MYKGDKLEPRSTFPDWSNVNEESNPLITVTVGERTEAAGADAAAAAAGAGMELAERSDAPWSEPRGLDLATALEGSEPASSCTGLNNASALTPPRLEEVDEAEAGLAEEATEAAGGAFAEMVNSAAAAFEGLVEVVVVSVC
jgi:hypothetical protein